VRKPAEVGFWQAATFQGLSPFIPMARIDAAIGLRYQDKDSRQLAAPGDA
jgi:hypothetical protein